VDQKTLQIIFKNINMKKGKHLSDGRADSIQILIFAGGAPFRVVKVWFIRSGTVIS